MLFSVRLKNLLTPTVSIHWTHLHVHCGHICICDVVWCRDHWADWKVSPVNPHNARIMLMLLLHLAHSVFWERGVLASWKDRSSNNIFIQICVAPSFFVNLTPEHLLIFIYVCLSCVNYIVNLLNSVSHIFRIYLTICKVDIQHPEIGFFPLF